MLIDLTKKDLHVLEMAFFWAELENGMIPKKAKKDLGKMKIFNDSQKKTFKNLKSVFNSARLKFSEK